jgi:hypothetical protein
MLTLLNACAIHQAAHRLALGGWPHAGNKRPACTHIRAVAIHPLEAQAALRAAVRLQK